LPAPIGIFGGTFDPVHFGHLRMAQELAEALALDTVRLVPAAVPPHRGRPRCIAQQRREMLKLAIADNPLFVLDSCELERDGPSYTVDTLTALRASVGPDVPLCLFVGADAFNGLSTWHRWESLIDLAHIVVAHRPGASLAVDALPQALQTLWHERHTTRAASLHQAPAGRLLQHRITALDISSSAIREALHAGRSCRYLLPEAVRHYIHTHHLYESPLHES